MEYPTRDEIRSLCTEQSFERGVTYFGQDRILELQIDGGAISATVRGSSEYRVSVDAAGDAIRTSCSCPYDYAGDCKHIVAVLLAVEDRQIDVEGDTSEQVGSSSGRTDLETLVERTAASDLREFLLGILREDRDVRDQFVAFTAPSTDKTVYDYKQEIDRLFDDAAGRGGVVEYGTWVDFAQYHDLATTHRERGHVEEATDIYRALAETIRENFERVDDSSGHYGQELARAIEEYAETVLEQDPDHEQKRPRIEYLCQEFIEADYSFASDYYDDALQTLCTTDADLEYWLELLDAHVSGVDLDPTAIEPATADPERHQTNSETDNCGQSPDDERQSDDTSATDREWVDDVLYASDLTDGPLTTDDFTGGTLDIKHLAVGPLEIGDFVGDAFDELRVDDQTTVEDHTADIDETGSTNSETGVASSLRRRQVLSTYIYLLGALDEDEPLTALYEDIYLENSTFCKEYAQRLIDRGDQQHAIEVVENGLETFGSSSSLRWLAVDLYRDRHPDRYRDALERLFLDHSEWSAYDELKDACSDAEWADIYQEFEWHFDENDRRRLIAMYVHEGELEKAFSELQTAANLSWVRRYRDPVATVDPVEYFELYRELLVPFAANDTGRRHYREIADHLAEMQELVSAERFEEFVDFLKKKHSNRPAFLDELETAGF